MGERKSWALTPITRIEAGSTVCVGGKLFLTESKDNYEGDKITYTLYLTDLEGSITASFSCPKSEAPKLPKAPAYIIVYGRADHRRIFDRETKTMVEDSELTINVKAICGCKVYGSISPFLYLSAPIWVIPQVLKESPVVSISKMINSSCVKSILFFSS